MIFLDDEEVNLDATKFNENNESEENKAEDIVVEEASVDADKDAEEIVVENGKAQKKSKNKKPSKLKGAFSELKKVTWPTFGRVVKETIVVLSVTIVFLVVIFGIDRLLSLLYNFLTKSVGA